MISKKKTYTNSATPVQDYIPGASLLQLLEERKRFSELEIRSIATEIRDWLNLR